MDIPVGAAAPWIVLGGALAVLFVTAGALVLLRAGSRGATRDGEGSAGPSPAAFHDDLPGFLESPPGSDPGPHPAATGWAALTPAPRTPRQTPPRTRWDSVAPLAASGLALALLVGVAAAVGIVSRSDAHAPAVEDGAATRPEGVAAELTFGGVVLERRAVGVTATYPRLRMGSQRGQVVAHVELPRFNCLTAEAPRDPVAAGCTPAGTEYARLASPALSVDTRGDRIRISGRFPTTLRPNGSPPVPTGRTYELEVTAEATTGDPTPRGEWLPATAMLHLGSDSAPSADAGGDRLRFGD